MRNAVDGARSSASTALVAPCTSPASARANARPPSAQRRQQLKDADKHAKEAAAATLAKLEADSKAWSDALDVAAAGSKASLSKEEKEKLKKNQSKARNTFRKLIRATATLGLGGDVNDKEYGRLTEKQVDLLCTAVEMDELNELNTVLGGEPAAKDPAAMAILTGKCGGVTPAVGVKFVMKPAIMYAKA
jgi:hypothetical protein